MRTGVYDAIRSEGDAITSALAKLDRGDVAGAKATLRQLQAQVTQGFHRNPGRLVVMNPPLTGLSERYQSPHIKSLAKISLDLVGVISNEAHSIRYVHADDKKPYEHKFESNVTLFAARLKNGKHVVLVEGTHDNPVWEDV